MLSADVIAQGVQDRLETEMAKAATLAPDIEHKSLSALMRKKGVDVDARTVTAVANRPTADRDGEVIDEKAWDLKNFRTNPVLMLSHDYCGFGPGRGLPVGRIQTIEVGKSGDLLFTAEFAPSAMGDELLHLYANDIMRAFSVGFIPKQSVTGDEIDRDKFPDASIRRVFTKVELLEISCVAIGAHPEALVNALESGEIKTKSVRDAVTEALDAGDKGVIGYRKYDLAPIGAKWDAAKEVAAADVKQLRKMSTWFDSERSDAKSAYKLPHHRAADLKTVWRAVSAAMGALLGARGGVKIPKDDRKGVFTHLSKHYAEFEKIVPEFRDVDVDTTKERVAWSVDDGDFIDMSTADEPVDWIGAKEVDRIVVSPAENILRMYDDDGVVVAEITGDGKGKVLPELNAHDAAVIQQAAAELIPQQPVLLVCDTEPKGVTAEMVKDAFATVTAENAQERNEKITEIVGDEVARAFGKATRES